MANTETIEAWDRILNLGAFALMKWAPNGSWRAGFKKDGDVVKEALKELLAENKKQEAVIELLADSLEDCRSGYIYVRDHISDKGKSGIGYSRCITSSTQALKAANELKVD